MAIQPLSSHRLPTIELSAARQLSTLVAEGDYAGAADLLHNLQFSPDFPTNSVAKYLFEFASFMCQASAQARSDTEWYQQAAQTSEKRLQAFNHHLHSIIELLEEMSGLESYGRVQPSTVVQITAAVQDNRSVRKNGSHPKGWQGIVSFLTGKQSNAEYEESTTESPAPSETDIIIYSLGTFQVYRHEQLIDNWPSRKGLLIFKYLLLNRKRSVQKEILMERFWPDSTEECQRNNLNVAIYGLRQALRNSDPSISYILFQNECYLINPALNIWLDYDVFMEHYQNANRLLVQGKQLAAMREYETAETLYQGDFLPEDCFEDWTNDMRHGLQTAYVDALNKLSGHYFEQAEYAACIPICNKILTVDACTESAHTLLMRCYSRQGQPHLALRQFDRCVKALAAELDTSPLPETRALYAQIRSGEPV